MYRRDLHRRHESSPRPDVLPDAGQRPLRVSGLPVRRTGEPESVSSRHAPYLSASRRFAKIAVRLVQPVLARRIKDVEIHGVLYGFGLVWNIGWDAQDFAGTNNDLLAFNPEFQSSFENVRDLFVIVSFFGD